jgi:hypothetical protein
MLFYVQQEEFEDTKEVIRIRKSKDKKPLYVEVHFSYI